jgi:hypothetical protein
MITLSCPLVLCSLFPCSLYEGYWAYFRYPADHECSWLERFSGKTFSTEHIKHAGTDFASRIHRPDTASILVNRDTHLLLHVPAISQNTSCSFSLGRSSHSSILRIPPTLPIGPKYMAQKYTRRDLPYLDFPCNRSSDSVWFRSYSTNAGHW